MGSHSGKDIDMARRIVSIGECMIEMSGGEDRSYRLGYAGDTLNTAWYLRALLGQDWSVDYVTALGISVLIVYVMNVPVSNALQGGYVTAIVLSGCTVGAAAMFFAHLFPYHLSSDCGDDVWRSAARSIHFCADVGRETVASRESQESCRASRDWRHSSRFGEVASDRSLTCTPRSSFLGKPIHADNLGRYSCLLVLNRRDDVEGPGEERAEWNQAKTTRHPEAWQFSAEQKDQTPRIPKTVAHMGTKARHTDGPGK